MIVGVLLGSTSGFICNVHAAENGASDNAVFGSLESADVKVSDQQLISASADQQVYNDGLDFSTLSAQNSQQKFVVLGSVQEDSDFKYELVINTKGAAIETARLNGIFTRGTQDDPLVALAPVKDFGGAQILSLANYNMGFEGTQGLFPLHKVNWQAGEVSKLEDGSERIELSTMLYLADKGQILKLTKIFTLTPGVRDFACDLKIENLSDVELKFFFDIQSPLGFGQEGVRQDMRRVALAFVDDQSVIDSKSYEINNIRSAQIEYLYTHKDKYLNKLEVEAPKNQRNLLWAATANKYFVSILRPLAEGDKMYADGISVDQCRYYDAKYRPNVPTKQQPDTDGTENVGFRLKYSDIALSPAGSDGSSRTFSMNVYLGPKDQSIFENNETYRKFGYMHAIDFRMCCASLFRPISLGILALMKGMYHFIPNYGLVIIILVLLVRAALHPLTKKGQVSMMKMSKMAPKMEEIKKRYANDKTELNRKMMEVYREQGASPMLGMLPMFIQMPIWFSLYAAIYASIDLRGAHFLPIWITDLSAPDAMFNLPVFTIPLVGTISSFNLLPILMGVAMFMQQKMMPTQASAANPQMAQQQKMMLYMMPAMMMVFLYNAPSGLNLYIMTSIFGGVIEQKVIRKHIAEKEKLESKGKIPVTQKTGGKLKKKKPKPFFKN